MSFIHTVFQYLFLQISVVNLLKFLCLTYILSPRSTTKMVFNLVLIFHFTIILVLFHFLKLLEIYDFFVVDMMVGLLGFMACQPL